MPRKSIPNNRIRNSLEAVPRILRSERKEVSSLETNEFNARGGRALIFAINLRYTPSRKVKYRGTSG